MIGLKAASHSMFYASVTPYLIPDFLVALAGLVRLAVIGDVHGRWYKEDAEALQSLGVDAAIFVGDFGEESLGLIKLVASAPTPKAVILGNHDAWYNFHHLRRALR